ncbi:16836_t:CDS:2, partial [Acaulospora colombiana]
MSDTSTPATTSNEIEEKQAPTLAEGKDLQFDEDDHKILHDEKITNRDFLSRLRKNFIAMEVKEKKMRSFSSYRSLKEMLENMVWNPEGIDIIPLFELLISEIQDDDVYFEECITEINKRLRDYGTLYPDSLEAMHNDYVVAILHTALHIVRDDTKREFSMRPQQEIISEEISGPGEIAQASELAYTIEFNKKSLNKNSEECQAL